MSLSAGIVAGFPEVVFGGEATVAGAVAGADSVVLVLEKDAMGFVVRVCGCGEGA